MEENKNGYYLNINGEKIFIAESEEAKRNKQLEKISLELKKETKDKTKGFLNVNEVYVPYEYKVSFNNTIYYLCLSLAEGQHAYELKSYCNATVDGKYNDYDVFVDFIKVWCKFNYKVITYKNDINVMYIFNDKYSNLFDNTKDSYSDLD